LARARVQFVPSFLLAIYLFFYLAGRASPPNDYIISGADCT